MNIGDYVRTKKGTIYKFNSKRNMAKNGAKKYMVKSSPNIIDLIEVGDYVNGIKIDAVYNGILIIYDSDGDWYFTNEDIESIVTKEQFEAMKYKIGDKE